MSRSFIHLQRLSPLRTSLTNARCKISRQPGHKPHKACYIYDHSIRETECPDNCQINHVGFHTVIETSEIIYKLRYMDTHRYCIMGAAIGDTLHQMTEI